MRSRFFDRITSLNEINSSIIIEPPYNSPLGYFSTYYPLISTPNRLMPWINTGLPIQVQTKMTIWFSAYSVHFRANVKVFAITLARKFSPKNGDFQDKTLNINMPSESRKVLQNEKGGYRFPPENSGFGLCKVAQIISEGDNGGGRRPRRVSRRYVRGPPLSR